MAKKRIRPRLDPRRLAAERIKLVSDRKPEDAVRFAVDGSPGPGHVKRGRGMEPIARVVWRVLHRIKKND